MEAISRLSEQLGAALRAGSVEEAERLLEHRADAVLRSAEQATSWSGAPELPGTDAIPVGDVQSPAGSVVEGVAGAHVAVGWFPAGDYERALELWPDLRELWHGIAHREYCRRMQASLRGWALHGGPRNLVALRLDDYLAWCEQHDHDPTDARALYAADMARLGRCQRWPPGRNDPCWCGSGLKYKRCCASVTTTAAHPLYARA